MQRAILVLATLALLAGGVRADADFIYGIAQVTGSLDDPAARADNGPNYGFSASASASSGTERITGSGNANVTVVGLPGFQSGFTWQLHSDAHLAWNVASAGFSPPGRIQSDAFWRDVLFLSNTDPLLVGQTLRLNFYADLFLSNTAPGPGGAPTAGTLAIASGTNIYNPTQNDFASHSAGTNFYDPSLGIPLQILGSWDTFQPLGGGFYHGTFHLDIPIVPGHGYIAGQTGSFYYQVQDQSLVSGQSYFGAADAADPSGFTSITLPDVGNVTPESLGVSVTFQSGIGSPNLEPSAVPEPCSLLLVVTASLPGICYFGWRRKGSPGM